MKQEKTSIIKSGAATYEQISEQYDSHLQTVIEDFNTLPEWKKAASTAERHSE